MIKKEETTDDKKRSVNTVQYCDVQWVKSVIDQGVDSVMENPFIATASFNQVPVPARMSIPTKSLFWFQENCWLRKSGHAI